MVNLPATAAALVAVVLIGYALVAMSGDSFGVAGASFLSASIIIYIRETYLLGD